MPIWTLKGPRLVIRPHTCMGDSLICNGLYRHFAEHWPRVAVLAISGSVVKNVRFMLSDVTNIEVIEVGREWDMDDYCNRVQGSTILRLGFASGEPFDRWHFDTEWYRQAGVPFEKRFTLFKFPECPQVTPPKGHYTFVHDRPDMCNAVIGPQPFEVRPGPHPIFAYRDIIQCASELHCCSSSFAAFADSFDLSGKPLFFYSFGREIPVHRNIWQYVN